MAQVDGRVKAVIDELDKGHSEYQVSKAIFLDAQVHYEASREKFSGLLRLAAEMLPEGALANWKGRHPEVQFMGMVIGDAIVRILDGYAFESAWSFVNGHAPSFQPHMTKDEILNALFAGGHEFKSASPLREVNATLIKLVRAVEERGRYRAADSDDTLQWCKGHLEEMENAPADEPEKAPF